MDPGMLLQALRDSLEPSKPTREAAEALLNEAVVSPGFPQAMLALAMDQRTEPVLRHCAATYLKNTVSSHWSSFVRKQRRGDFVFADADRQQLREQLVPAIIHAEPASGRALCETFRVVLEDDFMQEGEMWNGFPAQLIELCQRKDPALLVGTMNAVNQVCNAYRFKKKAQRGTFEATMEPIFAVLLEFAEVLRTDLSPENLVQLKMILKIFYKTIEYQIPDFLMTPEALAPWMALVGEAVDMAIGEVEDDSSEWPKLPIWKVKKWATNICCQFLERYASQTYRNDDYAHFAKFYVSSYAPTILDNFMDKLVLAGQGVYFAPRVHATMLRFVNVALEFSKLWLRLRSRLEMLVSDVLFPLLCHTAADEEVWRENPFEYIRAKFDLTDYAAPETAAGLTLVELVKKRGKASFDPIITLAHTLLQQNHELPPDQQNNAQIDGSLHIVHLLAHYLTQDPRYSGQLEHLLATYVFPQFHSPHGYLRARACRVMRSFEKVQMASPEHMSFAVEAILHCLEDPDMVVRLEAGLAFRGLLRHEIAVEALRPHLETLMRVLFTLLSETESDDLTDVMRMCVKRFGEEMMPFATQMASQLAETWTTFLDYDPEEESEQYKVMGAMGLISTLKELARVFHTNEALHREMEAAYMPVFRVVFEEGNLDFAEEALQLAKLSTKFSISPMMLDIFRLVHKMFKTDCGIEYLPETTPLLYNFVRNGGDAFIGNPEFQELYVDLCKQVFTTQRLREDEQWHAGKNMEILILYGHSPQLDEVLPIFVGLAVEKLVVQAPPGLLRVMCMNIVIAGLYYNPELLLRILEGLPVEGESLTSRFLAFWFRDIEDFTGMHNRKLGIIALCRLLDTIPFAQTVPAVQEAWPHIMGVLLALFSKLPIAYRLAEEIEEVEDDDDFDIMLGEDDEEEDLDETQLSDDEDEANPIDEAEYIKALAAQAAAAREGGGRGGEDGEQDEDEDDDDEFDEGHFGRYKAPLDLEMDEYLIFRDTIHGLEQRDPASFGLLMSQVTPEQHGELQEVLEMARRREQLAQSKAIQAQGGYNFAAPLELPKSFNFGGQ